MTTFVPAIQIIGEYDNEQAIQHLQGGLYLEFLREYCMEHGERRVMERGETLEVAGEPAQWVAYVERGCFKYMVHNDEESKDYCTGFAFEGEFVSDFPYCLDGDVSEVSIEADMPCEVRVISRQPPKTASPPQSFFAIATTKFYVCEEKSYTQRTISTIYKSRPTTRAAFP